MAVAGEPTVREIMTDFFAILEKVSFLEYKTQKAVLADIMVELGTFKGETMKRKSQQEADSYKKKPRILKER